MDKKPVSSIFDRNVPGSTEKLRGSVVGIAGCGGLGSNAAVALVRAGIGKLILVDFDVIELSNLNRQYYFQADIGKSKVDALSSHLLNINPDVVIVKHDIELTPGDIPVVFGEADLLIEAFDRAENKHWLIETWCKSFPEKPVVCASGVSGIGNSSAIEIKSAGNIYIIGDEKTDSSIGLCSARVAIAANMEANIAIEILAGSKE